MEWIRISETKLKLMLNAEDTRRYALYTAPPDLADFSTQKAFREILADIQKEIGFDASEEKVYIQMFPSKGGGCELFITKATADVAPCATEDARRTTEKRKQVKALMTTAENRVPQAKKRLCYSFASLSNLICCCERLLYQGYQGESAAWRSDSQNYLLFLEESLSCKDVKPGVSRVDPLAFLREYGKPQNTDSAAFSLSEHGSCFCESSAVEILGMLR